MSDTFGCGQILPGFGPGNSSDSPLGGGGDIPNDDDWTDWDKFDGEKDDGGPPGPPLEEDWQCRIVEAGTEGSVPCFDSWKEDCYEWTYTQDCIDISLGDPQHHDSWPPDTSKYDVVLPNPLPDPGGECMSGGSCPPITISAWNNTSTPPPGGDGGGGPTVPGGGPGTPGPPGPTAPGPNTDCTCVITEKDTDNPCTPPPGADGCQAFKQECKNHFTGNPPNHDSSYLSLMSQLNSDPKIGEISTTGEVGGTCRDSDDHCGAPCDRIVVTWKYKIEGGDPPQQFDGGGNGGIFTGGDKTGGKHGGGVIIDDDGGGGGPDTVPPGGGGQIPKWYCTNTGGVKGCVYNAFYGPKTATYKTKAACLVNCQNDNGDKFFDGETTEKRDKTGGVIIDGGGGGGGFFTGGTTGARDDTGAGGMESSNQNTAPPIANLGNTVFNSSYIDLNSPRIRNFVAQKASVGIMDPDISITGANPAPPTDTTTNLDFNDKIFGKKIHKSIHYTIKNNNRYGNWDSTQVYSITQNNIIKSMSPQFLKTLREIRKIDGSNMSDFDIYKLVSRKIIDGTISDLDIVGYQDLSRKSQVINKFNIKTSPNPTVNEYAGVSLLEQNLISLAPSAHNSVYDQEILKNWKIFSTDINKYIEVRVGSDLKKYYIGDNNSLLERNLLQVQDGEYISVKIGEKTTRLYTKSEIDHAYIVPESTRQQAIKLLGGTGKRTLSVSAPTSDNLEFNYSLSSPRQKVYVLKIIPSSVVTTNSLTNSNLLKDTICRYEWMSSSSAKDVRDINSYIKYKANYRPYFLPQNDLIFDYIESTSSIHITQEDVLFDAPKTNKSQALLVRQVPWYIFIIPSNRENYLSYGGNSKIVSLDPYGATTRQIKTSPSLDTTVSNQNNHQFITYITPYFDGTPDVYGTLDTQTRISIFNPADTIYSKTCVSAGVTGSVEDFSFIRKKTTFRLMREILQELNSNYVLDREGTGVGINTFDLISRLGVTEFNKFTALENSKLLFPLIREGLIDNIKVYPPVKRTGVQTQTKTRIIQRRKTATPDKFISIKSTEAGEYIIPPDTTTPYSSSFGEISLREKSESLNNSRS